MHCQILVPSGFCLELVQRSATDKSSSSQAIIIKLRSKLQKTAASITHIPFQKDRVNCNETDRFQETLRIWTPVNLRAKQRALTLPSENTDRSLELFGHECEIETN